MLCEVILAATIAFADGAVPPTVLVVVGAEGAAEYGEQFRTWAGRWEEGARRGGAEYAAIGLDEAADPTDRDDLQRRISEIAASKSPAVWLVLIGHGTFDGKKARFNLRGPDVSAPELASWLREISAPLAIINSASCSGPFLTELSAPGRVVITATKSGHEHNFARFGDYLSTAIGDASADLDKDEQVSLLEAWLLASSRVAEYYASEGRLATEHALLDDTGDRLGTPPEWFQGTRAVKSAQSGSPVDGALAARWHLVHAATEDRLTPESRARRDTLEAELAHLRALKKTLPETDYLDRLEPLLIEIARLYAAE